MLVTSTVATHLLRDAGGRIVGVRTDREQGELWARVVVAADGVNSFLAKEAGLMPVAEASHHTLGVKEVLDLPRPVIDERFGLRGDEGVDIEMLGCTRGIPGGGFLYTNADTVSLGVVLSLTHLAEAKVRPEELIADLKGHPSIAPYLRDATLREYSAHLIPEGGYDTMPVMATDGMLVAGDAAAMTLAAGLWLEGVNFAIGSGLAAGRAIDRAIAAGDCSAVGLASYRADLEGQFVLADHKRLRKAPGLVLSERIQQRYPGLVCDLVEGMFTVTNPDPQAGGPPDHPGGGGQARGQAPADGRRRRPGREDLRVSRPAGAPGSQSGDGWPLAGHRLRGPDGHRRVPGRAPGPTSWSTRDVCRSCTTQACVTACPANLFAPTVGGRHPLQLRGVLRVRDLLHGLQPRRRHRLDLPRRRPGRRLPPWLTPAPARWWSPASGSATSGPGSIR